MRFIGSKERLLPAIGKIVRKRSPAGSTIGDLFCGTASVAAYLKQKGYRIIANDNLFFCTVMAQSALLISDEPTFKGLQKLSFKPSKMFSLNYDNVLGYLNNLTPSKGFIYQNYSLEGTKGKDKERNYFSGTNAAKIDAIRLKIEEWYINQYITYDEKCLLITDLLNGVVAVSNTAGTYGYFLKNTDQRALKELTLRRSIIIPGRTDHLVFNKDANELASEVKLDMAYLDPPYNWRQYAAYYHILETIAKYDSPKITGKSGLRPWDEQRSRYSYRNDAQNALSEIISKINAQTIIMSYNADGLIAHEKIIQILSSIGSPEVETISLPRYISTLGGSDKHTVKERLYHVSVQKK